MAQEKGTFPAPQAQPAINDIEVIEVRIARPTTAYPARPWELRIEYADNTGKLQVDYHLGIFHALNNPNGADVLAKQLNKANLSVKSLECRAIEHLASEGKIPAGTTCTGTPQ